MSNNIWVCAYCGQQNPWYNDNCQRCDEERQYINGAEVIGEAEEDEE